MAQSNILIKGAREHNLRDIQLELPRNRLICFTGVSGSGKSSLAFDTLYAEGQRRYVESLSSFARQFLGQLPKPNVDHIAGLSPSISISQKTGGQNPRSTVGTITEIYDFLRVLFARVGTGYCPECDRPITAQTRRQIIDRIETLPPKTRFLILAPLIRGQKGEYRDLFEELRKQGFVRARVDGEIARLSDDLHLDRQMRHNIEVVVDRLTQGGAAARNRLAEAVERALDLGSGNLILAPDPNERSGKGGRRRTTSEGALSGDLHLSARYACTHCDLSFEPPSPQMFSFNSPQGMCPACDGLGEIHTFDPELLIPDPTKSFQQGCVEPLGRWREMGRWRRHIYKGVADTLERRDGLSEGTILETAWEELDEKYRKALLWGTGNLHITFTWRSGPAGHKWGGTYEGIVPRMLSKYRSTKSRMHRRAYERYMRVIPCVPCAGERLNRQARSVRLETASPLFADQTQKTLPEVCDLSIRRAEEFFSDLKLDASGRQIAEEAMKEIRGRLGFLMNVGLDYLTLARTAPTLSGGEMQRIRLAGQIGCGLVGVLYILDEPSIGLHPRDNDRLLDTLRHLRDQGNTVIVVEHDEDTMHAADHLVDFGPGPGVRGGHVVACGSAEEVTGKSESVTGGYLSGERKIAIPEVRRPGRGEELVVRGASHNNLKRIDFSIPLGKFLCVTGVSGSGKSSLVNDILVEALRRDLNGGYGTPGAHTGIDGLEHLDKMIAIDQSPIGRTPRSNPATYIKVFDEIRRLFAELPEARQRGYKPGRFSFNVAGGRCEACEGNGAQKLEMDFLADIWVTCPVCEGRRFNHETLHIRFKGKSIDQVLNMDIQEALEHFENIPKIRHKLQTLHDVGLDYMKLGQPSPTLSGGEAQRVKLARELVKKSTGKTLYLLDEPTTGLHFADIEMLLKVLHDFADSGNTVLVVEHNLDVIKTADWVIDLGPEGGAAGGRIVAEGTPETIAECEDSYTGRALRRLFEREMSRSEVSADGRTKRKRMRAGGNGAGKPNLGRQSIAVRGARQHNLKDVTVDIPRDRMTVCCGPSGSGKTSLAMDTVYAEGQRRYVESLSAYARQFVGQMQKPRLEHIEGLSPAIAIEQKSAGHSPRSTVGTVTEIHDYLRVLFARLGKPYCPHCDVPIGTQSLDEIVAKIQNYPEGARLYITAPVEIEVGQKYAALWEKLREDGFIRVRVDGFTYPIDAVPEIDRRRRHLVEVIIDRLVVSEGMRSRLSESVESALDIGRGVVRVVEAKESIAEPKWPVKTHSQHLACDACGRSFEPLTPHHFSFNSSLGWCPGCEGLGVQTGANPALLLHDPQRSLSEGALALWPDVAEPMCRWMLEALSRETGIPLEVPYEQLDARHRRLIMHGAGETWFDVHPPKAKKGDPPWFRFQYKGLYPALEEAGRLVPSFRGSMEYLVDEVECSVCSGSRLREDASAVRFLGETIDQMCRKPLGQLAEVFREWEPDETQRTIAGELIREVKQRLGFLNDVGLEYLTLGRPAPSLSGGESQRIRLAAQVGSGLVGVLYVLDEPTIGLHPRDNRRLIEALRKLRDLGNTLLLVEHDREVVEGADHLLDFGPEAGKHGGEVVARGTPEVVAGRKKSVTGPYLSGEKTLPVPSNRRLYRVDPPGKRGRKKAAARRPSSPAFRPPEMPGEHPFTLPDWVGGWLTVRGARHHNLKEIDVPFPLGTFSVVTGPSGSGKSSLVEDVLYRSLARDLHRAGTIAGGHDRIDGVEGINKVIRVDQQPLGQTPTSNPATYTGLFELIRQLFAQLPEAKLRGYTQRRFSFNVAGGRCEKCEGNGQLKIEMHFLPDVWITCDACDGKRYDRQTLEVKYRGRSIADVLEMSCTEALGLFEKLPKIRRILQTLCDVGLDYVALGQPAPTLSGGEAQRVKLASELARPDTGNTLYLLDEPTTGLHFTDLQKLLEVLHRLVDLGNTVVVIEHNLDVIKSADWIVELGPEAGLEGGHLVFAGPPEELAAYARKYRRAPKAKKARLKRSYTGEAIDPVLKASPYREREIYDPNRAEAPRKDDVEIEELGAEASMPWEVNGRKWHTEDRVGRTGNPCRWDGRILNDVVDRIQEAGIFAETDWRNRSVVEIRGEKKSLGWFFHAITAEEWLLKMKFRTGRGTFRREEIVRRLALPPLNEMPDIPLYGTEPRVKCRQIRGPWQEVELRVHSYDEIDRQEFWEFLDQAIAGFGKFLDRARENPEDLLPWKKLGRKWHLMPKGFYGGPSNAWSMTLLEKLLDLVESVSPDVQPVWTNKVMVPFLVDGGKPWAWVHTKKADMVQLDLKVPKRQVTLGSIRQLGVDPEIIGDDPKHDVVSLKFRLQKELKIGRLRELLKTSLEAIS